MYKFIEYLKQHLLECIFLVCAVVIAKETNAFASVLTRHFCRILITQLILPRHVPNSNTPWNAECVLFDGMLEHGINVTLCASTWPVLITFHETPLSINQISMMPCASAVSAARSSASPCRWPWFNDGVNDAVCKIERERKVADNDKSTIYGVMPCMPS